MAEGFDQPIFNGRTYENPKSFTGWIERPSLSKFIYYRFGEVDNSKIPTKRVLDQFLPVESPNFNLESKLSATWLGHATVFVHLDGINFITDPCKRASPFHYIGPLRYRPTCCSISQLPMLNFAVISHNHYDHLDLNVVRDLSQKFPLMEWFVPKGLKQLMKNNTHGNLIHEMGWGENVTLPLNGAEFKIWCLPAQHWSQRTVCDRNISLWCGWAIEGIEHKFYFAGNTGFCEGEFAKMGENLGPFHLAAIPIGCYSPRNCMKSQHIDPEEAVKIHRLIKAVRTMGIHWGTYEMGSMEHYLEPAKKFRQAAEKYGYSSREIFTINHGATWSIEVGSLEEASSAQLATL